MTESKKPGRALSRRSFLKSGLCTGIGMLSGGVWLGGCGGSGSRPSGPNIVLISIDTLRADHLGCYGYDRPTSPVIDEFATGGVVFADAMSTSPWTLPAHGSMLTGLYPSRHGMRAINHSMSEGVRTLAEELKEAGYKTGGVVNSMFVSERYGFDRGFDDFWHIEWIKGSHKPSKIGDEGMKWLSKQKEGKFFLFLHYYDVHSNYESLKKYEDMFVRPYDGTADGTTAQLIEFCKGNVKLDKDDMVHLIDLYDASIRQMDDQIARVLDKLRELKMLDDTLVVITSDHGEEFLEHGDVLHGSQQYQEVIHVPLIFTGLDLPKAKRVTDVVSLVDIMPTLLGTMGIETTAEMNGVDLSGFFKSDRYELDLRPCYAEGSKATLNTDEDGKDPEYDRKRAIRLRNMKLVYDRITKAGELYNLKTDPSETKDIKGEHGPLVKSLSNQLEEFMKVVKTGKMLPGLSPEQLRVLEGLGYVQLKKKDGEE